MLKSQREAAPSAEITSSSPRVSKQMSEDTQKFVRLKPSGLATPGIVLTDGVVSDATSLNEAQVIKGASPKKSVKSG